MVLEGESPPFREEEIVFCHRAARWLELARLGRRTLDSLSHLGESVDASTPQDQTVAVRLPTIQEQAPQRPELMLRSLSTMMDAGIPLHEALSFLASSQFNPSISAAGERMARQLAQGERLSCAMEFEAFNPYLTGLVRVGEETGSLDLVLRIVADYLERSRKLAQALKSALVYPAILVTGSLILLVVGPAWLLEGHFAMLKDSDVALPVLTRAVMELSALFRSAPFWTILSSLVVWAAVGLSNQARRRALLQRLARIPWVGEILRLSALARFARALSISLRAGMTALDALSLSAEVTDDRSLKSAVDKARQSLIEGASLSDSLGNTGYFSPTFKAFLEVGEQSGRLEELLSLIADATEQDLKLTVAAFNALLEPLLLFLVGAFTALVLVATMSPTISLLESL